MIELSKTHKSFLTKLGSKKFRNESKLFLVEGEKSIRDMIDVFEPTEIITTNKWLDSHPAFGGAIKIYVTSKEIIGKISSLSTPPEILGVFKMWDVKPEDFKFDKNKLYILLDGVQDPGNVGTIIRTAYWFGVPEIILSEDCADIYNPKTIQATMGALKGVKVWRGNPEEYLNKAGDVNIIGMLLEGENIYECKIPDSGILILGSEGKGISAKLRKKINFSVTIPPFNPMNHPDSLNVGVACGIALSLIRK